jgi:predicted DNA-binding transcriptional regulator
MWNLILEDIDSYVGNAGGLSDQLEILKELKAEIENRIEAVEQQLEDIEK